MPGLVPGAPPAQTGRGGRSRERLNLIEQITKEAVASDYAWDRPTHEPRAGSLRQRGLVVFAALGLAGFVLALGVSTRIFNSPVVNVQRQALLDRIEVVDDEQSALIAEVTIMRLQATAAQQDSLRLTAEGRALDTRITQLEMVTGYLAAQGPGAIVGLSDAPRDAAPLDEDSEDAGLERVLDSDIQVTVNGLWSAGADAIAVNGQRLTAQSAIRSAAGAILVNYRPLKPPYLVEAIGPPDLADRFGETADAEYLEAVSDQYGIEFDVSSADRLVLRPATAPLPDQATAVGFEGGEAQ